MQIGLIVRVGDRTTDDGATDDARRIVRAILAAHAEQRRPDALRVLAELRAERPVEIPDDLIAAAEQVGLVAPAEEALC